MRSKALLVLGAIVGLAIGVPHPGPFPGSAEASEVRSIVGAWRWMNGADVECHADGRCSASNGFAGHWRSLHEVGRFEIQWARPGQPTQFVDTVEVALDGRSLAGRNQFGVAVGAERVSWGPSEQALSPEAGAGDTRSVVGAWRWMNGARVDCFADGRCTASNGFAGRWRSLQGGGRFEIQWARPGQPPQFFDTVEVATHGRSLAGRNQFGAGIGAERLSSGSTESPPERLAPEPPIQAEPTARPPAGKPSRLDDYEVFDASTPVIDCRPGTATVSLGEATGLTVRVEVYAFAANSCQFHEAVIADEQGLGLAGLEMTCRLPAYASTGDLSDYCEGGLVTAYLRLAEGS